MNKKMKKKIILACALLVALVAAILLIVFLPSCSSDDTTAGEIDLGIDITRSVNAEGLHVAKVNTNDKGEIENNSESLLTSSLQRLKKSL